MSVESASAGIDDQTLADRLAEDRRRGWWTLVVVASAALLLFGLLWLAPIAFWFLTGNGPLDGID